jgi:hypothetical protein
MKAIEQQATLALPLAVQCQGHGEHVFLLDNENRYVALMDEGTWDSRMSRAEEIVRRVNAGPELMAALEWAKRCFKDEACCPDWCFVEDCSNNIREVLKKAKTP